ncbi:MAG: ABC transporter ATP-binding protein [Oculatellaceae cyanobacterium Prado106]|nr:ABC transporter ATP-binding protein [Oculatellaceae cyanobacterium Prado106]
MQTQNPSTPSMSVTTSALSVPVLAVHDLWKSYKTPVKGDRNHRTPVVQGVSFNLHRGEVLGLLGPNGAGKTTTVGMLYGAVLPDRGTVQLSGLPVQNRNRMARMHLGVVTQDDNLDPDFNVFDNLIHFAHHYGITGKAARKRAGEILAQVNLENVAKYRIDRLSGGMRRRLALGRALINHPKVIFLDEPTTGLDPDARQDFWKLITELKREGCGILLTTHYMDEAQRLCDRLLLLQQGQVIDEGTPNELILRIVGHEVVELEDVAPDTLEELTRNANTWYRPFGTGYIIALPNPHPETLWHILTDLKSSRIARRRANLEDVFIRLTGSLLS